MVFIKIHNEKKINLLKFRSRFNIMIISCLLKLKIDNTLVISDLRNFTKIVFVPNNLCAIRCKISILKSFFSFKCQKRNFSEDFAQKMFFLILFFRKKRMPAWQGTHKLVFKQIFNTETLEY